MAQKKNLLNSVKEKATQTGEFLSDKATEAKDKVAQTGELVGNKAAEAGEFLSDKAVEAKDKAVQTGEYLNDKAIEAKKKRDLRRFKPITKAQLPSVIKTMPEMVRIIDWDKRKEEDACKSAVAFNDGNRDIRVISILTKNANLLGATFYPFAQEGIYYRDPCNPSLYINLNDYFDYIKKAKVHELNQIAQALGAKHIKITLKAEKKVFVENKAKLAAAVPVKKKGKDKAEASLTESNKQFVSIEVASDKKFKGHEAKMPDLKYFKNEPDIMNIITRRLDTSNPIFSDVETFKYNNSSGIKMNDVAKIEGILKKFKVSGNASITNEVENEEKIYFEYQIEYPED